MSSAPETYKIVLTLSPLGGVSTTQVDSQVEEAYRDVGPDQYRQSGRSNTNHHRWHCGDDKGRQCLDRIHVNPVDPIEPVVVVCRDYRSCQRSCKPLDEPE